MKTLTGLALIIALCATTTACRHGQLRDSLTQDNINLAKKILADFNRHDWAAMTACYRDTALFLDPTYGPEYVPKTHPQLVARYAELQNHVPNVRSTIKDIYADGDKVIVETVFSGTQQSGTFTLPAALVLTIKNNKIVREAMYYNAVN